MRASLDSLARAVACTVFLACIYWCFAPGVDAANTKKLIGPNPSPVPTVSPVPDLAANPNGVPQPTVAPTCVYGKATVFGDNQGCLYSCNSNIRHIINRGGTCIFNTPGASSTPVAP